MATLFYPYKSMGIFFRRSRAANSTVGGWIWPNFKLLRALMHVIITCKYEKDWIKNSREKVATPFFSIITLFVAMETSSWIWPNFKLIQALMYVIVTCKYEMDPIKNSREKVATPFLPLQVYGDFFRRSRAVNSAVGCPIWLNFELFRAPMHIIVTCKYQKDQMKNS